MWIKKFSSVNTQKQKEMYDKEPFLIVFIQLNTTGRTSEKYECCQDLLSDDIILVKSVFR